MYELWIGFTSVLRWICAALIVLLYLPLYIFLTLFISHQKLEPLLSLFCWLMVQASGIKVTVEGLEYLEKDETYILTFNHVNVFDHFIMNAYIPKIMRGVEKASHFKWPIYGSLLKAVEQVPVSAGKGSQSAKKFLEKAKELYQKGINIAIAPEGTRSPTGLLMPFKKGAFHLAVDLQAKIAPLVLKGMKDINLKSSYKIYPKKMTLKIMPVVECKGKVKADVNELRDQVYAIYAEELGTENVLRSSDDR